MRAGIHADGWGSAAFLSRARVWSGHRLPEVPVAALRGRLEAPPDGAPDDGGEDPRDPQDPPPAAA